MKNTLQPSSSHKRNLSIQQKLISQNQNQISEYQKSEQCDEDRYSHSQANSNINSVKPSTHNVEIENFNKQQGGLYNKKNEDKDQKDKKHSSQKDFTSQQVSDNQSERKQSLYYSNIDVINKQDKPSHKQSVSNMHRLSIEQRQQFANFRIKRDLWIRDLQEVFNKIYENFVQTLQSIKDNVTIHRTKVEKLKFRKHLRSQMKEIKKIVSSLSDKNDQFINLHDNAPITHYYKNNIMEMHKLLSILLKLQMDNKQLDKIKTQIRYDNKCSMPLSQEIKRSTRRVQRLKAGNRLGQVIQDQLDEPDIANVIQEEEKKKEQSQLPFQPVNKIITKQIILQDYSTIPQIQSNLDQLSRIKDSVQIDKSLSNTKKNSINDQNKYGSNQQSIEDDPNESDEDYDPYSIEQDIDKKYFDANQKFDIDHALKDFNKKKEDLQNMIQKFVENVDNKDFNFNDKYINFRDYFASNSFFSQSILYLQQFLNSPSPIRILSYIRIQESILTLFIQQWCMI